MVSITVKPMISDCTGRIYFTDLMVQEGDRLTGYVINTETILQKYREDGSIVPPRFYNGVVRSAETVVLFNLGSDTAGLDCYLYPVQDMAAGSISVALGAGAHKASFPGGGKRRGRAGPSGFFPEMPAQWKPHGKAGLLSIHGCRGQQASGDIGGAINLPGCCFDFRKCRKEAIGYEGLSTRQALHGLVVHAERPDV